VPTNNGILNIIFLTKNNYDYSTIASNTPLLSKVPSEESFTNYLYREHSYEEHDDTPISILHGRSEGNENSHQLFNSDMKKEDYDIYNTKKKHKDVMDSIRSREMEKEDHNVNNIGENLDELIFNNNPTGVNEFESIIQNEEPINVSKDDENRKETPKEQKERIYQEEKERIFKKAQEGKEKYIKKYIDEYIIKGNLNNETTRLNKEEFEIYNKYKKFLKPTAKNFKPKIKKVDGSETETIEPPTYWAVKKFYERNPQKKKT